MKRTTVHNLHVQNNILLVYFLQLKLKKEISHSQKDNIWLLQGPEKYDLCFLPSFNVVLPWDIY